MKLKAVYAAMPFMMKSPRKLPAEPLDILGQHGCHVLTRKSSCGGVRLSYEHFSALGARGTGVSDDVVDSAHDPESANSCSGDGESQTGDEKRTEKRGVVLSVVGVGSLGW